MEEYYKRLFALTPSLSEKDKEYFLDYTHPTWQETIWLDKFKQPFLYYYKSKHNELGWNNFVYDRTLNCVLIQFGSMGSHEIFMSKMHSFYITVIKENKPLESAIELDSKYGYSDGAERFITDGLGFFMSSVSRYVNTAKTFKMTKREQDFFEGFKFRNIDE